MIEEVNKELVDKYNHVIFELAKVKEINGEIQMTNKELKRQNAYLSENLDKLKEENGELIRNFKNYEIMKNKEIQLMR